jgi:transmembrane sensor
MADRRNEALDWHERLKNDPSPQTKAAYEQWMLDPENAREFEQQGKYDVLIRMAGMRGLEPDPQQRITRRRWMPLLIGAGALAVVAVAALMARPAGIAPQGIPPTTIASAPELSRARLLPDGSVVILSHGAELGELAGGASRGANLFGGSARFIVVHDPAHPFVVRADGLTVTARGTIFDIDLTNGQARVTLVKGKIDVQRDRAATPSGAVITLVPGQMLGSMSGEPRAAPSQYVARVNVIEAERLPLGDIVRIVNAQGRARLELADPALAARLVTGRFDIRDVHALGERLVQALGLKIVEHDGSYLISAQ